jgi:hypothetical protein
VLLLQQVASGPGGLASAATLRQTCKYLFSLSEGPAVTYSNLSLAAVISSPDHPVWEWLAKRSGRISGLRLELCLKLINEDATHTDQLPNWSQPLEILSGIRGVQLRVTWE